MFKAEMIADSISKAGHRISTMLVTMPRIVLAEFNTHRMFTRNSASSRAIPFKKLAQSVRDNSFIPLRWMKDHPGMQGTEFFTDELMEGIQWSQGPGLPQHTINSVMTQQWLKSRDLAVEQAEWMNRIGLTKQICNRLLEPFMWHTVLVTATDWENFFALRDDDAAEIHIREIAHYMLNCMNNSDPKLLEYGDWHMPFGDQIRGEAFQSFVAETMPEDVVAIDLDVLKMIELKIATARCAQTSYTVVGDGEKAMDFAKLTALHDRLATAGHWSPFEHCAYAMNPGSLAYGRSKGYLGNFQGWYQYRKHFQGENRKDPRLIKKTV